METNSEPAGKVGSCFGLPNAPCLLSKPIKTASFSVTRLYRPIRDGKTSKVEIPPDDAYFLMLYLQDVQHCDIVADGLHAQVRNYEKGSICLADLSQGASIRIYSDLDVLGFHLPRSLFDELTEKSVETRFRGLRSQRGETDPVMANLGVALMPLLDDPSMAAPATLQHIAIAVCAHLLHCYGDVPLRYPFKNGTLSVWQEKAAKEFMLDNFGKEISVAAIAAAAGLSSGYFSRGFKTATGLTPHQWLMKLRVSHAKQMLMQRLMSLAAIAERCGFADQSHFTKVFTRETGMTPAVWRDAWRQ